jgi:hypothetical protein
MLLYASVLDEIGDVMVGLTSVGEQGGSSPLTALMGYCCLISKIYGTKLSCGRTQTHHCTRHTYGTNALNRVLTGSTKTLSSYI